MKINCIETLATQNYLSQSSSLLGLILSFNTSDYDEFMNDTNNAHNALLASLPLLYNMGWNALFARSLFSRRELIVGFSKCEKN